MLRLRTITREGVRSLYSATRNISQMGEKNKLWDKQFS